MSTLRKLVLILPALLLGACSAQVITVEGNYPTPQVSNLPLTVGVYYDPALLNYTYTEVNERNGKDQYIVQSGPSQKQLFNSLLAGIFTDVVEIASLENVPGDYPQLDAVFVPMIDDFQLGLPEKTRLNSYEVWIKYNMRLSELDGSYIADWVMTAYGKSPSELSTREGINNAANLALRDLAASFALGARNVPEVRDWLRAQGLNQ